MLVRLRRIKLLSLQRSTVGCSSGPGKPIARRWIHGITLITLHSMWHELRVVLHNRENTLLTEATKAFAREERDFSEGITSNWGRLAEALEPMPFE